MRRRITFILFLCLPLWAGFAVAQGSEKEEGALAAAQEWLSIVDSGDYWLSWSEAAEYFRNAVTDEQWVQSLKAVRKPFGKLISRDVKSTIYKTSLAGAPDGEYVVIQFKTAFENKSSAIETVTPMVDKDGSWRVSGYFIK
jgi:hypothetical protein